MEKRPFVSQELIDFVEKWCSHDVLKINSIDDLRVAQGKELTLNLLKNLFKKQKGILSNEAKRTD